LPVELLDRRFRNLAVGIFDECETSRPTGLTVKRAHDLCGLTDRGKVDPQVLFGGLVREITYEQSNWWHGIVEGREELAAGPLGRSITKTLQRAKLGLQRPKFLLDHLAMRRVAGRLKLGLRVRQRQL
jgi:hypothetical protein